MYAAIDPATATGETKDLLDATQRQLGRIPNLYRTMAHSPKALGGYLAFRGAIQGGKLNAAMCERIALLTAQLNNCDYCIAAHTFRSQKVGLPADDIRNTRLARSDSEKVRAALAFVVELIEQRGNVRQQTKQALIEQGWAQDEIGEMVAHVALNVFSNYFKQVAEPELDFPPAPVLEEGSR